MSTSSASCSRTAGPRPSRSSPPLGLLAASTSPTSRSTAPPPRPQPRRTALALEPTQSDRPARRARRASRGVGRGVLSPRHGHMDAWRRGRLRGRVVHEGVRVSGVAHGVRDRARSRERRGRARAPTGVVGRCARVRGVAGAPRRRGPARVGSRHREPAAVTWSRCWRTRDSKPTPPTRASCSSARRRGSASTWRAVRCSSATRRRSGFARRPDCRPVRGTPRPSRRCARGLAVLTPETLTQETVDALAAAYDVVLLDVGDTLVAEAEPGTPTAHLVAHPMPGVLDTLHRLQGRVRLGAVTNTSVIREGDVRSILEGAGVNGLLEVVVTSTDVGAAKPDPLPVLVALDQIGAMPRTRALRRRPQHRPHGRARRGCALRCHRPRSAGCLDPRRRSAAGLVRGGSRAGLPTRPRRHGRGPGPPRRAHEADRVARHPRGRRRAARGHRPDVSTAGARAPAVGVFAADHGVVASGVTPWPQAVTAQMVANFAAGGAAINAIAAQVGASVRIVDVGVASDEEIAGVEQRRVHAGTADLAVGPAMTVGRGAHGTRRRRRPRGGAPRRGARPARHRRHGHREHHGLGRAGRRAHRPSARSR